MAEFFSLMITLPAERMEAISKRAIALSVTSSMLANYMLDNGIGIDALSHVHLEEPKLYLKGN